MPSAAAAAQQVSDRTIAFFELGVSLYVWRWQALSLAVENEWGGPDSSDKRDWLAGVLADLFTVDPTKEVDPEDVEDVATQVIGDEFSVVLEDDSAYELSMQLTGAWKDCLAGDFSKIEALRAAFQSAKPGAGVKKADDEGSDSSGTDAEVDDDTMELDGGEAAATSSRRQEPVIDDDGFELVQPKAKHSNRKR